MCTIYLQKSVYLYTSYFQKNVIMKRQLWKKLLEWKHKENRKPLIIRGARQVGKTWFM